MEYIVDGILLLIFASSIIVCASKGLTRGVAGIIAWIVAAFVALHFCAPLAQTLYTNVLQEPVQKAVSQKITGLSDAEEVSNAASSAFEKLPDFVVKAAGTAGVDVKSLQEKTKFFVPDGGDTALSVESKLLAPVIIAALKVFLFLLMVIGISLLGRLIFKPVGMIIHKIPVIGQADKALGGVFGIVKGAMIIAVLSILLKVLSGILEGGLAEAVSYSKVVSLVTESSFSDGFFR